MLNDVDDIRSVIKVAEKITDSFKSPLKLSDGCMAVTASIGIAI